MDIRDTLLAADDAGTLLESLAALAATKYNDIESVATVVSELHNYGEINIFSAYESSLLDAAAQSSVFLRNLFCKTLPLLHCSTDVVISACENMFEKADIHGDAVYDSLTEWFRKNPTQISDGLSLIHEDMAINKRLVKPVLFAWASHDAVKSTEEAINLVNQEQVHIRLDAIRTLGRIVPIDDDLLITHVVNRLERVIESPDSENDTAHAIETTLILLGRTEAKTLQAIEPLLIKASTTPSPATLYALAFGLQCHQKYYSEAMVDKTFSALQETSKQDHPTITVIDRILYLWDLDHDRNRIFRFLIGLLDHSDDAVEFYALESFRYKLRREPGSVLGWYVVSLLLTGKFRLCSAAVALLPYNEIHDGFDLDLSPFSLPSPCILYLSRKILGYCIFTKKSAAALLLSCLRDISDTDRAELENLIFKLFLMNYLTAIDWFEQALAPNDPAGPSVQRLSQEINAYMKELEQTGNCLAFRPNEKERQQEGYRLGDKFRNIQKKVEENSILSSIAHKSNMLYGTAAISYIYVNDHSNPERQEISLKTFGHEVEIPRMEIFDPVGFHYSILQFQNEPPPK